MMAFDVPPVVFVFGVVVIAAAVQDILSRRISNLFPLAIIVLFLVTATLAGWPIGVWGNILSFLLIFMTGALLFRYGVLGGGDVKLWSAVALWFNPSQLPLLILSISLAGGLLALLALLKVFFRKQSALGGSLAGARSVPYGVAIALGALLTISVSGVGMEPSSAASPDYRKLDASLMNTVR